MTTEEFVKDTQSYWKAAFSFIGDDLPDGAWFQSHIDLVDHHKSQWSKVEGDYGFSASLAEHDAHDIVCAYLRLSQ